MLLVPMMDALLPISAQVLVDDFGPVVFNDAIKHEGIADELEAAMVVVLIHKLYSVCGVFDDHAAAEASHVTADSLADDEAP
jgi:hypothetical protein